jgi:UPF0755 protein
MNLKKVLIFFGILMSIAVVMAYIFYGKIFNSNVVNDSELFIPHGATMQEITEKLQPILKNTSSFQWVANKMKYKTPKSGRYYLKKGMNNYDLIAKLRIGAQDPVKITFNNQDSLEKLAGRLATQLEPDSLTFLEAFKDERFFTESGFTQENALALFIPNSYELYWNISAEQFRGRMLKEYQRFWNDERLTLAKRQNLTPLEVVTLAAIVQKETATVSERKTVAGLYLNRLKNSMLLQSDPTVIYAWKQRFGQDIEIKRVLLKHLEVDSPYNTYKNEGLPPAPIAMPDISSIDAVLNPEVHDYYYMCASVADFGKHVFAKTLTQHNINAAKYQKWVAQQGY